MPDPPCSTNHIKKPGHVRYVLRTEYFIDFHNFDVQFFNFILGKDFIDNYFVVEYFLIENRHDYTHVLLIFFRLNLVRCDLIFRSTHHFFIARNRGYQPHREPTFWPRELNFYDHRLIIDYRIVRTRLDYYYHYVLRFLIHFVIVYELN